MMAIRMFLAVAAAALSTLAHAGPLYKHVDEKGNVVFSDRPASGKQKPEKAQAPNVASRHATRQYEIERQEWLQRRREEEIAARRLRYAQDREAARQRAAAEALRHGLPYDPALPNSPAPSSERQHYYNGR
jgi:Domain of unknown function (DUF4124)